MKGSHQGALFNSMEVLNSANQLAAPSRRRRKDGSRAYHHDQFGILRTPTYPTSLSATLIGCDRQQLAALIRQLLADEVFLEALYIASPSLHQKAVNWLDGESSPPDVDLAIARYALRMAHRCTPFGAFSSVAAFSTGPGDTALRAPDVVQLKKSVVIDFGTIAHIAEALAKSDDGDVVRFRLNDTISVHSDYISYIKIHCRGATRAQHLEQLERSEVLDFVLKTMSKNDGKTINELSDIISSEYASQYSKEEVDSFVNDLKAQEILVYDALLDPTSDNQVSSMLDQLAMVPKEFEGVLEINGLLLKLSGSSVGEGLSDLKKIHKLAVEAGSRTENSTHVVTFSPDTSGLLSDEYLLKVEHAVENLAEFSPKLGQLQTFKDRFTELFGDASVALSELVPILDAMGYPDEVRASAHLADRVLALKKPLMHPASKPLSGPEAHAISLLARSGATDFIDISDYASAVRPSAADEKPSSCLVAWLALWTDGRAPAQIELKSCGAQEPGRIMGRFANAVPELSSYLNGIEHSQGNSVITQIVCVPVVGAGNVICRTAMAGPEMRLRAGGSNRDVTIEDVAVFLQHGRVVLWSKSRDAEIIPRMNSAHSFERCTFAPLYVFLNHVANQDHRCHMPSLRAKLPESPFLPGLVYREIIIERPSWRVTLDSLGLTKNCDDEAISTLRSWASSVNLPDTLEEHGKPGSMIFSLRSDWMARDFVRELRRSGTLVLTCAFPKSMQPFVSCSAGPRMHEIQIALRNPQARLLPAVGRRHFDAALGEGWIYVCAYCKSANQNGVIASLHQALKAAFAGTVQFFFVRYREQDGEQVRFRVKSHSSDERKRVMIVLEEECLRLERSRAIFKFEFRKYLPEVERYLGPEHILLAERVFMFDSVSVLRTFGRIPSALHESWRSAAVAADALLRATGVESWSERLAFSTTAAADFQQELRLNSAQRRLLGEIFRASKPIFLDSGAYDPSIPCLNELTDMDEIRRIFAGAEGLADVDNQSLYRFRWSLIHMRFNRIFARIPRAQEAMCWELLKRSYMRCINLLGGE